MNDHRPDQGTRIGGRGGGRRGAVIAAAAVITVGLVGVVAAPSQAATTRKAATSVSITSITGRHGPIVVDGSDIVIRGTASANLVGKTLTLQVKNGATWAPSFTRGTVSTKKTFTIPLRAGRPGSLTFRAVYSGSSKLAASASSPRTSTVYAWQALTLVPYVETVGSASNNASPAVRTTGLTVNGVTYPLAIAGKEQGSQTGASEFTVKGACLAFRTSVGLVDGAPSGTSATFMVSTDGVQRAQRTVGSGAPATITVPISGAKVLTLLNSTSVPPSATGPAAVVTAWPNAQVLCDVEFTM